jgi:predicted DsbA family dithiol-disulfide isomerase
VFDALQKAFFMDSKNIGDVAVIEQVVKTVDIDFERWKSLVLTDEVRQSVENELQLASHYGIRTVPSLVVNKKHIIAGALQLEDLMERINSFLGVND